MLILKQKSFQFCTPCLKTLKPILPYSNKYLQVAQVAMAVLRLLGVFHSPFFWHSVLNWVLLSYLHVPRHWDPIRCCCFRLQLQYQSGHSTCWFLHWTQDFEPGAISHRPSLPQWCLYLWKSQIITTFYNVWPNTPSPKLRSEILLHFGFPVFLYKRYNL